MTPTTSAFQRGMTPSTSDALQRGFTPTHISHSQRSPIDPIYQAQTNPLTYQAQQSSPARQKPDFGLKPGGVLPPPPNDLVMTTIGCTGNTIKMGSYKYHQPSRQSISMSTRIVHEQPNQTSLWHRVTYPTIWFHFFKRNTTI